MTRYVIKINSNKKIFVVPDPNCLLAATGRTNFFTLNDD